VGGDGKVGSTNLIKGKSLEKKARPGSEAKVIDQASKGRVPKSSKTKDIGIASKRRAKRGDIIPQGGKSP